MSAAGAPPDGVAPHVAPPPAAAGARATTAAAAAAAAAAGTLHVGAPLVSVGVEYDGGEYCREDDAFTIKLSTCSDQLGLPAGAGVEWEVDENGYSFESQETFRTSWSNDEVLEFFRVQQRKVMAFASGMHARLGAASVVSGLNEQVLIVACLRAPALHTHSCDIRVHTQARTHTCTHTHTQA